MLVLLATFLPIAAYGDVVRKRATRHIILWTSALVVLLALAMEGKGTFISMGVKIALLPIKIFRESENVSPRNQHECNRVDRCVRERIRYLVCDF